MYLLKLDVKDVRNLTQIHLDCHPQLNLIIGGNAAGKTSILESIHMLARAASFRTPKARDVIQYGKPRLVISALVKMVDGGEVVTGIEKDGQNTLIKYNGNKVLKRSEQARNLPVFAITTESHRLLYGTPKERRHWLDWSLFHVEPAYMQEWHEYHYALRQRNALLRHFSRGDQFDIWEDILAKKAVMLNEYRREYLHELSDVVANILDEWEGNAEIRLRSEQLDEEQTRKKLQLQRKSDAAIGHTQHGPHRDDVRFEVKGIEAGKILSRGEGKYLVMCLLAIQGAQYKKRKGQTPILLVDDLPSELDESSRKKIVGILAGYKQQMFITATSMQLLTLENMPHSVFHVEHGNLIKVIE